MKPPHLPQRDESKLRFAWFVFHLVFHRITTLTWLCSLISPSSFGCFKLRDEVQLRRIKKKKKKLRVNVSPIRSQETLSLSLASSDMTCTRQKHAWRYIALSSTVSVGTIQIAGFFFPAQLPRSNRMELVSTHLNSLGQSYITSLWYETRVHEQPASHVTAWGFCRWSKLSSLPTCQLRPLGRRP